MVTAGPNTPLTTHPGALCRAADGAVVRALPILCLALGILLGAAIVRQWRDRRLPAAALAVVVLAPALITVRIPAFVAATVSSHCSDDQQAAIDRWRQGRAPSVRRPMTASTTSRRILFRQR
ncbi:MAG: hypothetical protein IPG94_26735 [Kineosporiaceae bacterium]|nr:hypothetical protein [Kineosporiaceae bacterium]